ncbi:MAG: tRNA lysidine(34) synthetase TilS [bacterium]
MKELFFQIVDTIKRFHLITAGDRILVAVSGGPDSMALFHLLWNLKDDFNLYYVIAHVNHLIRSDAYKDEELVRKEGKEHDVRVVSISIDVKKLKEESGLSLETAAREARYQFLEQQARKLNLNKIALGHTANDQAETILMRILRGSGLHGISGIAPLRGDGDSMCYIRPLIQTFRYQIMEFLHQEKIPYRHDTTNFKADCLRNKIRLHLIPHLIEEYNPNLIKSLLQTGTLLRDEYEYLQNNAEDKFKEILMREKRNSMALSVPLLRNLHPALLRAVIRIGIKKVNEGRLSRIRFSHCRAIEQCVFQNKGGVHLDLPFNIKIEKEGQNLIIYRKEKPTQVMRAQSHLYIVKVPGLIHLPALSLTIETKIIQRSSFRGINKNDLHSAYFDYNYISYPLYVRTRQPGDRFQPLGLRAHKKVKEFFINQKVPRWKRDHWPILLSGEEIIWIMGLRIAHPPRITDKTTLILLVRWEHYMPAHHQHRGEYENKKLSC